MSIGTKYRPAEVQFNDSSDERLKTVTMQVPFDKCIPLVESAPAPKRPNRSWPENEPWMEEMNAWEAASDEALENLDREFPPEG